MKGEEPSQRAFEPAAKIGLGDGTSRKFVERLGPRAQIQPGRSRLDAAQFHAVVMHELSALSLDGYSMAAGGILVQVPEEEAAEATAFLDAKPEAESGGINPNDE